MKIKDGQKKLVLLFTLALFTILAYSQDITLKGRVIDNTDKTILTGATIILIAQKDSIHSNTDVTDSKGNFYFYNLLPDTYTVKVSFSGYEKVKQKINLLASNTNPIIFPITKLSTALAGVTVIAHAPPVKMVGDTTEFKASEFKVNPDATAEDLIKKFPGITVAKDGTVTTMGEQVQKVTVDGKDFFGNDATAALRNLPADVIDKIQVFDKLSDQAQLTGFDDGNSIKTVNIVTKDGVKNGQFGRVFAGIGTPATTGSTDTYNAGGNISFFKGNRRVSLVGNFNNINQQNFGSQDLLGVTSGGGRGGGGGFGGNGGYSGGAGSNFNVGQTSGISKTNAAGINFSNDYGKKITVAGSYFFNNSTNNNQNITNTETFLDPKNLYTIQNGNTITKNTNHRINMRIEYKIDSFNSVFIIPSVSLQKTNVTSYSAAQNYYATNDSTNTSLGESTSDKKGYNIANNILFRHSFAKRGRTISLGINTGWAQNDGTGVTDIKYRFFNNAIITDSAQNRNSISNTMGNSIGGNIAYTEPIGKKGQIQISYTPSVQKNTANQHTYDFDGKNYTIFDTTLTNVFKNTVITNNAGLSYRLGRGRDDQLMFGINYQHTQLQSNRVFPTVTQINQPFSNLLPNLMYMKKISKNGRIRIFYRASTNFPSITQLQDVVNLSNPLSVSSGNPALKQSYTNTLNSRYMYINAQTSKSFFANIMLLTASNYITNGTYISTTDSSIENAIVLKKGSQLTKPVNLNGYKSLRTFFTYSFPVKVIKTTINLNAGFTYSKLPGLINNFNTITNNYAYTSGVVFASNISEYVDFNLSYNASINNATTNTTKISTSNYINQAGEISFNLLNKKGWFLQNDLTANIYNGLSLNAGANQNFWLWNASVGKKIFKKQTGEIKLSAFDILKQNKSLVHTVTGAYIQDAQTQVLQQYFMLTFTYKLKNFGKGIPQKQNNFNRGNRGFGPPPGGFGGGNNF